MSIFKNKTVIGLTGMSGAGKTTASEMFSGSGFSVIDCDAVSRVVVDKKHPCFKEIKERFGLSVVNANGELDRAAVGKIIFSTPEKRLLLNSIMYPYISYIVIEAIQCSTNKIVVIDAPTLFESGIDDICDIKVSVVAEKAVLLDRIVKRDNVTVEAAKARLASQYDKAFYIDKSDFYVENSGDIDEYKQHVSQMISEIRSINGKK